MEPKPFLRGVAFPPTGRVPYPRAKPDPRLPADTWAQAKIPVGVRLELVGDEVEIAYRTQTDDLGYRGDGAGRTFAAWRGAEQVDEDKAELGEGSVKLSLGSGGERATVYLPEGMKPEILDVVGDVEPGPPGPRWIVYGDSVAEGWIASSPAMAWPAIVGRERELDAINMGYAGAARGEIGSAEHVAEVDADVITIAYGTNCWTRTPHSAAMVETSFAAFLDVVRQGHPETPIVVVSPIVRPDAETTANRLGASLEDIRAAIEDETREHVSSGDVNLELIPGRHLVHESQLGDGIHPNDDGHRALADAIGAAVAARLD
jgi:lysophospholipase L1-like esterase